MIDASYHYLLWAGGGFVVGGAIVGLIIRMRMRAIHDLRMTEADSRYAVIAEKLESQSSICNELEEQLDDLKGTSKLQQTENAELKAAMAALDIRVKRVPVLEAELAESRQGVHALQNDLRQESTKLAQALEKGKQLIKAEADISRLEEQVAAFQARTAGLQADIAELTTLLDEERKQAAEKIKLLNDARD